MTAFVVPFLRRKPASADWGQAELAEFYRVEAALIAAGMRVQTDRGLTDEGDPWFVFYHADDEQDVVIHFARIGGSYLVNASSLGDAEVGSDFRALVRRLLTQYDEIAARRRDIAAGKSGKVLLHPAAMLWVLVAMAFLKSAEARPSEGNAAHHDAAEHDPELSPTRDSGFNPLSAMIGFALQSIIITWATAVGALASEMHMGSDDTLLSWLAAEPMAAPEAGTILAMVDPPSAPPPEGGHGAPELGFTDHAGSSGIPLAALSERAVSERSVLDHGGDHVMPEAPPATITHDVVEVAPIPARLAPDPIPSHPVAEAQAVLTAAETNTNIASKTVETPAALPDAIATVLNHAIHPLGGDSIESTATQAKEALLALATTAAPAADAAAAVPLPGNTAEVVAPLPDKVAVASGLDAGLSDHPAAPTVVASTATVIPPPAPAVAAMQAVAATAPLAATSAMLDQVKLAVATSAVHEFLMSTPQAKTIASQSTLIVYDPLAVDIDQAHLQALTFDFNDGSHISLVGLPSELTHALTGHS